MNDASPWLPADFVHPTRVQLTDDLHLRPIRATDVDIDMPAVMGSRVRLWAQFGEAWEWPPATMTAAEDYDDLDRHEQEIARHESFNYALLNADETALYGCVYVDPPEDAAAEGVSAEVSWWVVDELVGTPVDRELDAFVPAWLAARWPFVSVRYPLNPVEGAAGWADLPAERLDLVPTPLPEPDRAAAESLWRAYCDAHPGAGSSGLDEVSAFGDSLELADELIGLVVRGVKRASAGLVADYAAEQEPLPRIGGHWIACDGSGSPRVVLRTVELRLGPVESVDDAFAWDEGEGDRSRAAWWLAHRGFWERTLAARDEPWDEGLEVVFERFAVVWPPEAVERGAAFARSVAAVPAAR